MILDFVQVGLGLLPAPWDPVQDRVISGEFKRGMLIEPLPELAAAARSYYSRAAPDAKLIFIEAAISPDRGAGELVKLRDPVDLWQHGIASLTPEIHASLKYPAEAWEVVSVRCLRLADLLSKEPSSASGSDECSIPPIEHVDHLFIDAEGHDYDVLSTWPFQIFHPKFIQLERCNLPLSKQNAARALLQDQGYVVRETEDDFEARLRSG